MIRLYQNLLYVLIVALTFIACKEEPKQEITREEKRIVILPPEELYADLLRNSTK